MFRPLARFWRGLGIHLGCEKDFSNAQLCSGLVRSDLVRAGLVASLPNSFGSQFSVQNCWGFHGLLDAVLSIPQPRVDRLISASNTLKDRLPVLAHRFVVAVVGKIISLSPCLGNVSLIMSRFLQAAVIFRDAWDTPLDPESPLDRNA